MNNSNIFLTETTIKDFITGVENRTDKNGHDYWVIRTKNSPFLAHSQDYNLEGKTRSLLTNYPHYLVNRYCLLKVKKQGNWDRVEAIELLT